MHDLQSVFLERGLAQDTPVALQRELPPLRGLHVIDHHKGPSTQPDDAPCPPRAPLAVHRRSAESGPTEVGETVKPAERGYLPRLAVAHGRYPIVMLEGRALRIRGVHKEDSVVGRELGDRVRIFVGMVPIADAMEHEILIVPPKSFPETDRVESLFPGQIQWLHF